MGRRRKKINPDKLKLQDKKQDYKKSISFQGSRSSSQSIYMEEDKKEKPHRGKNDDEQIKDSKLYLPEDTCNIVKSHFWKKGGWKFDNPSLFYHKIIPPKSKEGKDEKSKHLRQFLNSVNNIGKLAEAIEAYSKRIETTAEEFKLRGYACSKFTAITLSRMIVGLGGASVLETDMTFHRYGFPYIPASAVKGILASYLREEKENRYREIFGSQDEKGNVIFLDALPVKYPELELDIMNPHFGKYYNNESPPADYLTPIPITFLTVAAGSKFKFIFLSKDENLIKEVEKYLKEALKRGVGAKTAVGYGEMEIIGGK